MRKIIIAVIIFILSFSFSGALADEYSIKVNGNDYTAEAAININGRVLIPLRSFCENMGCHVEWNNDTQLIEIQAGDVSIVLTIGNNILRKYCYSLEEEIYTDEAPQIINNLTYVPIRVLAECLGYEVGWDDESKSVSLMSKEQEAVVDFKIYYDGSFMLTDAFFEIKIDQYKTGTINYRYKQDEIANLEEIIKNPKAEVKYITVDERNETKALSKDDCERFIKLVNENFFELEYEKAFDWTTDGADWTIEGMAYDKKNTAARHSVNMNDIRKIIEFACGLTELNLTNSGEITT